MDQTPQQHTAPPTVVLFGASGLTGGLIADKLVALGRRTVCVTRVPSYQHPGCVHEYLPSLDGAAVEALLRRHHGPEGLVVMSALGHRRTSRSPWARPTSPRDLLQHWSTAVVRAASTLHGVRVVALSAHGVAESQARTGWIFRQLVRHSNIALAFADSAAMEATVSRLSGSWLVLRPVILVNGVKTAYTPFSDDAGSFASITRAAVAQAVVDYAFCNPAPTGFISIRAGR